MAAMPGWGQVIGQAFKWIVQIGDWFTKRNRRSNVQGMRNDVANDNNAAINKRMQQLKQKAKNRDDSR